MTAVDFLSRYDIDFAHSLDQKGLGTVYTAFEKESGIQYAIKVIELHPLFDKGELLERYNFAASLSHASLLEYKECRRFPNEESVQHFVIMPYVKEGTLADNMEELGFEEKCEILEKVLQGLAYLHENKSSWQLLRSDHILLANSENGIDPKFINYGAKELLNKAFFTNYEYLAPEQLIEQTETFNSTATDIWAFAVLAFEMFTGVLPFGRKSVQHPNKKIMDRIIQNEISQLFDKIPSTYTEIIKSCLVADLDARPTAVQILETLKQEKPSRPTAKQKESGILQTLEKMGESHNPETEEKGILPFLNRKIKRKASKPISLWEPILWILFAVIAGYILSKL
jgi:serine/threonine protein kinase